MACDAVLPCAARRGGRRGSARLPPWLSELEKWVVPGADSRIGRPPFGLRWTEGRRRAAVPAPCLSGRGGEAGSWGSWGLPANIAARLRHMREKCAAPCAPLHGDFLNMVRSPFSPPCQHIGVWRMLRIEPRPFLPGPSHSYPVQRPHPAGCKKRPRENLTCCVANRLRQSSGCQPVRPSARHSSADIEGVLCLYAIEVHLRY